MSFLPLVLMQFCFDVVDDADRKTGCHRLLRCACASAAHCLARSLIFADVADEATGAARCNLQRVIPCRWQRSIRTAHCMVP